MACHIANVVWKLRAESTKDVGQAMKLQSLPPENYSLQRISLLESSMTFKTVPSAGAKLETNKEHFTSTPQAILRPELKGKLLLSPQYQETRSQTELSFDPSLCHLRRNCFLPFSFPEYSQVCLCSLPPRKSINDRQVAGIMLIYIILNTLVTNMCECVWDYGFLDILHNFPPVELLSQIVLAFF